MINSKCLYLHSCVHKCSSCSCLRSVVLRNISNTVTKTKKIDIILVKYTKQFKMVVTNAQRVEEGNKGEEKTKNIPSQPGLRSGHLLMQ